MPPVLEALARATACHRAGQLHEAEQMYRQILESDPSSAEARYLLGAACEALGKLDEAAAHLQQAVRLRPYHAESLNHLGVVRGRQGKLDEAMASFQQALRLRPDFVEAEDNLRKAIARHSDNALTTGVPGAPQPDPLSPDPYNQRGILLVEQGKLEEAAASFQQAIRLKPDCAEAHSNLGVVFHHQEKFAEAAACQRRALELKPDYIEALSNLGLALQSQRQYEEAAACYRRVLELSPDYVKAYNNLGVIFQGQAKFDEAIASYRHALELKPDYAEACCNLGLAMQTQGKLDEAVTWYRRSLELKPAFVEACNNLGNALKEQGKTDEAVASYQRALAVKPDYPTAHNNLGNAFKDRGRLDEAIACYRRALELKPDFVDARTNYLFCEQYRPGTSLAGLAAAHAEFDRVHAEPLRAVWKPYGNSRDAERPLRLGFVSADLGRHPVGRFLVRALDALARHDCEIICYSDRLHNDDLTVRINAVTRRWREAFRLTDEGLTERIRADSVDILFDLTGHTANNRLLVFARKPAPLQIAWIGYEGTTGLTAMDYIVADRYMIAPGEEPYYREKVLRLPETYLCYEPPAEAPPVGPLPALQQGHVTFGSFNNLAKINAKVVAVWAEILRRVEGSRLVLKYTGLSDASTRRWYLDLFAAEGVAADRLELCDSSPYSEMLAQYNQIDLALDPFPFVGGATTCEALWMGVPVLTCVGETFAGRHSLSFLSNIALTEMIARDLPTYVEMAVALANDVPRLAALRAGLRQRMAASPLCDGPRFAAAFMSALRAVWRQWCESTTVRPGGPIASLEGVKGRLSGAEAQPATAPFLGNVSEALTRAKSYHRDGDLRRAEELYRQILAADSANAEACYLLGALCQAVGQPAEAAAHLRQAVRLRPHHAEAHNHLGAVLGELDNLDEAIASFEQALRLKPGLADARNNLRKAVQHALRLEPDSFAAQNNLGNVLAKQEFWDEATACYQKALQFRPDYATAYGNLGNVLQNQGKSAEAMACYQKALELDPSFVDARNSLGLVLHNQGKFDEAMACFRRALELDPNFASAHLNQSIIHLLHGDFVQGWPEYEWRWQTEEAFRRDFCQPLWEGNSLEGKTILLHHEQGLGDTIQFVRYLPWVKQRGATVILECPDALLGLLAGCSGADRLVARETELPAFDVQAPLLSLPKIFGTTLENIPAKDPYLFAVPALVQSWRQKLSNLAGVKIGIGWQGSALYRGDRYRSMPLSCFAPLADVPGVCLVSLQKGAGVEQLAQVRQRFSIVDFTAELDEAAGPFMDTAAVMMNLDLVVTSDSAVAHLAGALGVPVWVVLPLVPDWRWLLDRRDSPWYPTMRLFRQQRDGDWQGVFTEIQAALRQRLLRQEAP